MTRWIVGLLFLAHGIAHGVGVAGSLLGAELEGGPAASTVDVGAAEPVFAVLFLVGLVAFVAAGIGVLTRRPWWRPVAAGAALISMLPVAVWWEAAFAGAYLNAFALLVVLAAPRIPGLRPAAPPARTQPARQLEGSPR